MAQAIKQISGRFHIETHLVTIGLEESVGALIAQRGVNQTITHLHNKEIFVAIAQNGVVRIVAFKVLFAECFGYPRHKDIVKAEQVEAVRQLRALHFRPAIAPRAGEHAPVKLGSVLRVVEQGEFGRCLKFFLVFAADDGQAKTREAQIGLNVLLYVIGVLVTIEPRDGFVGTAPFQRKQFRTPENVSVGIGKR